MVWYTNQSLLLILLAFLLGLLVGYLWWGLRLRRVRSSESATESITAAEPARAAHSASPVPSAAPIAAAVADPEPIAELAPEPVAEPVVEPVVAEPVAAADLEAEPVDAEPVDAEFEAEPVAAETEPVAAEAEPVAVDAGPVDAEPVDAGAESVAAEDEPVAAELKPVVVSAEPEPVDAELVADVESAFAAEPAADKLERIEGIGPKIAAALRAAGISTYEQLAAAERSTLEDALDRANLRFAPSIGTWSRQARLLADGDEAGFKELTDRLIAGREVTAKTPAPVAEAAEEPVVEASIAAEPEPVAVEPEPVAVEPEPVVEEPEPEPVVEELEVVEEPAPEPVVVPAQAEPVEDVEPDNLRRIEGIGPKMEGALIAAGIKTYQQLADAEVDALRTAIEAAGLRFAPSIVTWSRQARHLADGDEEGFADLTRRLVAGRDTGRA